MFSKTKPNLPDSVFMSLFNRHLINIWNLNKKINPDIEEKAIYEKINSDLIAFPLIDTFISWTVYEKVLNTVTIKKSIQPLFNFLSIVSKSDNLIERNIFPYQKWDFLGCDKNDTYPARVKLFAFLLYFEEPDFQETSFSNWMRVVFNIIENQTIDSMDSYLYALRLFSELGEHSHNIYSFLANALISLIVDLAIKTLLFDSLMKCPGPTFCNRMCSRHEITSKECCNNESYFTDA